MKVTLDHIGIAVSNLADALAFYRDALGLEVEPPEDAPSQRVRAPFIHLSASAGLGEWVPARNERGREAPGATIELLEATSDDSPIAKYIAKRGTGIHHIT